MHICQFFWSVTYFEQHYILIDWFVRSDAFKLCFIYQRPFSQRVKNIGSWQTAMEVMGIIGNTQNSKINIIVFYRCFARLNQVQCKYKFFFKSVQHDYWLSLFFKNCRFFFRKKTLNFLMLFLLWGRGKRRQLDPRNDFK